jgi:stage II sporulation protein D
MKPILKKTSAFFIAITIIILSCSFADAAVKVPETVRVGLYYQGKATASFDINVQAGLQAGAIRDNNFTLLYEQPDSNPVTVRKDTYFLNKDGKSAEYNPTSSTIPDGDKTGPIHVQLGSELPDYNAAAMQVSGLRQWGIDAYPVFDDTWKVWTGFFTDEKTAQDFIVSSVEPVLGQGQSGIVPAAANRIVLLDANKQILLLFAGNSSVLRFRVNPNNSSQLFRLNANDKEQYRGELEVRRFTGSDMTLINVVPTEQYLYGVVPCEIGAGSHQEALKAQAVAARTYTINNIAEGKHKKWCFDVCTTTDCQVYGGYKVEDKASNKGVEETAGKKVVYNGKAAYVFYFSSSGGRTEDSNSVWSEDLPYLKGVEDKYESGKSWKYNWEYSITAVRLKEVMLQRKYDLGDILSMKVTKTAASGRATELVIQGTKTKRVYEKNGTRAVFSDLGSQWYTIATDADIYLKNLANPPVKSQLGQVNVMTAKNTKILKAKGNKAYVLGGSGQIKQIPLIPTLYKFTGKGWGHAVGMSQEGAKGMAKAGFTYDQILMHYFQGTSVE